MIGKKIREKVEKDLELTRELIKLSGTTPRYLIDQMVVKVGENLKEQADTLRKEKGNIDKKELVYIIKTVVELTMALTELKNIRNKKGRETNVEKKEKKQEVIMN